MDYHSKHINVYVINTATTEERGEHWVCVIEDTSFHPPLQLFYDSYGRDYSEFIDKGHIHDLNSFLKNIQIANDSCLQANKSVVCGYYTCAFATAYEEGKTIFELIPGLVGTREEQPDIGEIHSIRENNDCLVFKWRDEQIKRYHLRNTLKK